MPAPLGGGRELDGRLQGGRGGAGGAGSGEGSGVGGAWSGERSWVRKYLAGSLSRWRPGRLVLGPRVPGWLDRPWLGLGSGLRLGSLWLGLESLLWLPGGLDDRGAGWKGGPGGAH